jgi:hypothetical protein
MMPMPENMSCSVTNKMVAVRDLEAVDTKLHFGGVNMKGAKTSQYRPTLTDLNLVYSQRKKELDDLIVLPAEKC